MISADDRLNIYELISLHGHLVDAGRLNELDQVFAADVEHDLSAFGLGVHHGLETIREAALALGDKNPLGHHVTNIVITKVENDNTVYTQSKGLGVNVDGTTGSVVYTDVIKRRDGKWRVVSRKIFVRNTPLQGAD